MIDAREGVAAEFCGKLFDALFVRPRDWTDQQAEAHITAARDAIKPVLPRSRSEALAVVQKAGLALKSDARTNAWPTIREVLVAVRSARKAIEGHSEVTGDVGWPHTNSDLVVEKAREWVTGRGVWPDWMQMEFPDEVAKALMKSGLDEETLKRAGYRERKGEGA